MHMTIATAGLWMERGGQSLKSDHRQKPIRQGIRPYEIMIWLFFFNRGWNVFSLGRNFAAKNTNRGWNVFAGI